MDLTSSIINGWKVLYKIIEKDKIYWMCECTCDSNFNKPSYKIFTHQRLISKKAEKCICYKGIKQECEICGDIKHNVIYRPQYNKVLCTKHNAQIKKYGYPIDDNSRTIYDINDIIIYEDYAEIVLYNKDNILVNKAIIDLDDINLIKNYKWNLLYNKDEFGYGYASTSVNGVTLLLHKLITHTNEDIIIDHIDCNKLNCRKNNLRIANKSKNSQNRKPPVTNTSGFTGVAWNKNRNRWYAGITLNRECINLGSSKSLEEAVIMRIKGEIKYFKEFRNSYNEEEFIKRFGKEKLEKYM